MSSSPATPSTSTRPRGRLSRRPSTKTVFPNIRKGLGPSKWVPGANSHMGLKLVFLCSQTCWIRRLNVHPQVRCGKCGNGLGHEFVNDGPKRGQSRFWIFSHSLKFVPKGIAVTLATRASFSLQKIANIDSVVFEYVVPPQSRLMDSKLSSWTRWLVYVWLEVWALDDEFWGKSPTREHQRSDRWWPHRTATNG